MIPTDTNMPKQPNERVHLGRNIRRLREMLGLKQEALALEMGDEWTQKKISMLEQKETIDDGLLEQVAKGLKLPVEAVKNFDEQSAINIISNTFENSNNTGSINNINSNCELNFNPLDKIVSLYESKIELYERMLKDKNEMITKLENLLKNR